MLLSFYYLLLTRFFKIQKINVGEFAFMGDFLSYFFWNVSLKQVMWHFFDISDKFESHVIIRKCCMFLFEDAVSEYFHCNPMVASVEFEIFHCNLAKLFRHLHYLRQFFNFWNHVCLFLKFNLISLKFWCQLSF